MSSPRAHSPINKRSIVCGRALPDGSLEITNAGHPSLLMARHGSVAPVDGANLPLGMFANEEYSVTKLSLLQGEFLVIYSDGVSEATNSFNTEYGAERLGWTLLSLGPIESASKLSPVER